MRGKRGARLPRRRCQRLARAGARHRGGLDQPRLGRAGWTVHQPSDAAEIIVVDRDDRHVYQPGLAVCA